MKAVLFLSFLFLLSCTESPEQHPIETEVHTPWFEDVALEWGVHYTYDNGAEGNFHIKEVTGGGAALFDYDNDGDIDLYIVQGAGVEGNALFENVDSKFVNRSKGSGADDRGYGIGVTTGDYETMGTGSSQTLQLFLVQKTMDFQHVQHLAILMVMVIWI
jgi:hypothetical protein